MLWNDDIREIKGIGDKTATYYRRIGINTVGDLVMHIPRAYDEYGEIIPISNVREGDTVIISGRITARPQARKVRNISIISAKMTDDSRGIITLVWFNMPFMANQLRMGTYYIIRGKVSRNNGRLEIVQPKLLTKTEYFNKKHKLMPIYKLTEGLSNNAVSKASAYALSELRSKKDYIPSDIIKRLGLMPYMQAIKSVHYPKNKYDMLKARKRLVFDEFFSFLLMLKKVNGERTGLRTGRTYEIPKESEQFIASLPYELTGAQKKVINEIENDMISGYAMNRLVQGDVGSGKTVIAAVALLINAKNGYQGALMAPTEVLARQHYESISEMFAPYGIRVTLLTGHMSAAEKRNAYELISSHKTDIIIGTHALIQDKVVYDNLGLVITDEQHRFGVKQRESIANKGEACHVMVMSATPIPRTLSMIIYGDMDISVIDEVPAVRLPIMNCVVGGNYRKTAYSFIQKEISKGNSAYIVCPMIEENENSDLENVYDYYLRLSEIMPKEVRIDILHGKMKNDEKNAVMDRFYNGSTDILISTTVIEVGINSPRATVMLIENSERFGLAQLHQLRGRVGRSDKQSYCIFMTADESPDIMKRLNILNNSNDGFYIASEDLKLRGPGDMFGVRQSGEVLFELADIYNDADMLQLASDTVKELSEKEAELILNQISKKIPLPTL